MVMLPVRWTEPVTLKICSSGTRVSAYNSWIFRRKILSLPRVIFNKLKNCTAAEAAQFLYETCATYHRYGQGFKSSVNRTERSVPFCDRGVFRMFISSTASCTCSKVYFIVSIVSCKSLPEGIRKSQQSSCLRKMLTRRRKKSQQSSCLRKMLTLLQ